MSGGYTKGQCALNDAADVAAAIGPTLELFVKQAAPAVQKVADEVYERLLYSVQDYLKENAEWNIGGEIERCRKIEAENRELRAMQAELAEALKTLGALMAEDEEANDPSTDLYAALSIAAALLARIDGGDQ